MSLICASASVGSLCYGLELFVGIKKPCSQAREWTSPQPICFVNRLHALSGFTNPLYVNSANRSCFSSPKSARIHGSSRVADLALALYHRPDYCLTLLRLQGIAAHISVLVFFCNIPSIARMSCLIGELAGSAWALYRIPVALLTARATTLGFE